MMVVSARVGHLRNIHVSSRIVVLTIGLVLLIGIFVMGTIRGLQTSLFGEPLSRVNIGYWGEHSYVLSLGRQSKQHYVFAYANSHTVEVPGGLAEYHIGALGKLSSLEQDRQIFPKALGEGSGVFIHRYLYQDRSKIYFDDTWVDRLDLSEIKRDLTMRTLFASGNLSLFDRFFILFALQEAKSAQVTVIQIKKNTPQLLLYDRIFRQEKKLVQILHSGSERTAYSLARLLENAGIRVADISEDEDLRRNCTVVEPRRPFTQTAQFVGRYFGCSLEIGDTGLYDTVWRIGSKTAREWEI